MAWVIFWAILLQTHLVYNLHSMLTSKVEIQLLYDSKYNTVIQNGWIQIIGTSGQS
jgi:hypothetical protein